MKSNYLVYTGKEKSILKYHGFTIGKSYKCKYLTDKDGFIICEYILDDYGSSFILPEYKIAFNIDIVGIENSFIPLSEYRSDKIDSILK